MERLIRETQVTPQLLAQCYELLRDTFSPEELNDEATIRRELSSPAPDEQYVMFAHFADAADCAADCAPAISLIAGCYLALDSRNYSDAAVGFIEYLATRSGFRQQGHASVLLTRFEEEMQRIAASQGRRLVMIVGEVEPEMLPFKRRRGYHWPSGSRYVQPPISFDLRSGAPLFPPVPKLLMVKPYCDPVDRPLFLEAVHTLLQRRFAPKEASPLAAQQAADYITRHVFEPFAASLDTPHDQVLLE